MDHGLLKSPLHMQFNKNCVEIPHNWISSQLLTMFLFVCIAIGTTCYILGSHQVPKFLTLILGCSLLKFIDFVKWATNNHASKTCLPKCLMILNEKKESCDHVDGNINPWN